MAFNKFQLQAINEPSTVDVLVSAGAGSGKTKTLSERVYALIDKGEVTPEELLVLTFTDNAAHEMKSRIIARFPKGHPLAARMLSSHVQTFDSFNAYLVRRYAARLGVPPGVKILPDSLYQQKKRLFLDEVINEVCADTTHRKGLIRFMGEMGLKSDKYIKESALEIIDLLSKLSPQKRDEFLEDIQGKFLKEDFAKDLYHRCVEQYKKQLEQIIREAFVLDQGRYYLTVEKGTPIDIDGLRSILNNDALYQADIHSLSLSPDPSNPNDFLDEELHAYVSMLELDDESFVAACATLLEEKDEIYFQKTYPGSGKKAVGEPHYHAHAFKALKQAKPLLKDASQMDSLQQSWEKMTRFDYGISLLCFMAKECLVKLSRYQKQRNLYRFSDITSLAMSLFTEPQFTDIAEELRERFTYIMVDEYQDTNDAQEIFIEGLLKPKKDGTRSHLFCVGDAKQSIYAFRGSNVALFRHRQSQYEKDGIASKVIPMAVNYRSAKVLLEHINYIFDRYMRLDHGGIDYTDPIERLQYDDGVNLYHTDLPVYGIHRIIPAASFRTREAAKSVHFDAVSYEAKAILHDIKSKLDSHYMIFDRDDKEHHGVRPCQKKDFCILVRRKKSVLTYLRLFNENGIALNNKVSENLKDANAVSLIQSLMRLISFAQGEVIDDLEHRFASVARSYIYQYDDNALHQILSAHNTYDREAAKALILADPIMEDVKQFAEEYKDAPFHQIFLALLERFHIIDDLYLIGSIEENLAKIESLYAFAVSCMENGEGLKEFVTMFLDMDKRKLKVDSETVSEASDAVTIMTIHASKGLERKIVYLPASENGKAKGSNNNDSLVDASLDYGVTIDDIQTPYEVSGDNLVDKPSLLMTLPERVKKKCGLDEEEQEHVRLLYVALTRAENALYLVGKNSGEAGVYTMMKDLPSFTQINEKLLQNPYVSSTLADDYHQYRSRALSQKGPDLSGLTPMESKTKGKLFQEQIDAVQKKSDNALIDTVLQSVLDHYLGLFNPIASNLDEVAKIYALAFYPALYEEGKVQDVESLRKALSEKPDVDDDVDDESEEGESSESSGVDDYVDVERLPKTLETFARGIADGSVFEIAPWISVSKDNQKDKSYMNRIYLDLALLPLARYFDHVDYVFYESYRCDAFPDDVILFNEDQFKGTITQQEPALITLDVDDETLEFPIYESSRASKKTRDEDLPPREVLDRGERLHRYLELMDLARPDTSFIPEKERPIIEKVLGLPLMQEAKTADSLYQEYGYYDEANLTTGSIDLLYVKDGIYHVVDYKSSHIEDEDYYRQVRIYGQNVMRLFHAQKENVRLHLLSIAKGIVLDVDLD